MAGYNHSNPQRVVYHATYPTPLAPKRCFKNARRMILPIYHTREHRCPMRNINNRCIKRLALDSNNLKTEYTISQHGDPIKLPENLETLPRAEHFPTQRHRWNTNEVNCLSLIR
ncbi:hypothetical protein ALC53_10311 [Atta colombica]|uniref:Uncharacterized protein n=1 Tax=Atta colombica TaxID=520822 RepID=A0A195B4F2_9HYME|nr:hypothetical protein ALC53_10311 [Atta colombica]